MHVRVGREVFAAADCELLANGDVAGGVLCASINGAKRAMRGLRPAKAFRNWKELGKPAMPALAQLLSLEPPRTQVIGGAPIAAAEPIHTFACNSAVCEGECARPTQRTRI